MDELDTKYRAGAISAREYYDQLNELTQRSINAIGDEDAMKEMAALNDRKRKQKALVTDAGYFAGALGNLGSYLTQAGEKNKAFAITAKVVNTAEAIMNTAVGVTNALAIPPPWFGIALAAVMGAAGALQIGIIQGAFAAGTDSILAAVSPGEMIFPRTMADAIRAGDISVSGREGRSMTGAVELNINIGPVEIKNDMDVNDLAERLGDHIQEKLRRV